MLNLKPFTVVVAAMVAINGAWLAAILVLAKLAPAWYLRTITPIAASVGTAQLVVLLVTMVLFATWIYLAGRNLLRAGYEDLAYSPASRVWWFAVPFANFVQPFLAMREL